MSKVLLWLRTFICMNYIFNSASDVKGPRFSCQAVMRVILLFSWVLGQDIYLVFEIHLPHFITLSIAFTTLICNLLIRYCWAFQQGGLFRFFTEAAKIRLSELHTLRLIMTRTVTYQHTSESDYIRFIKSMTFLSPKDVLFDRLRPPASLLTSLLFPVPNKYFNVQTISTSLTSMIIENSLSKKLQDLRQKYFTISYTITFISEVCCSNDTS